MEQRVKYEFMHLGIQCETETEAVKTASILSDLFNLTPRMGRKSVFAGELFECMKIPHYGTHGHIGMYVSDLPAAIEEFREKGYEIDEERMLYDDQNRLYNVFLKEDVAGFAIHLRQR